MSNQKTGHLHHPVKRPRKRDEPGTRAKLLEAAGQVFAEKGFDRATGKEICERAGANTAAINYHFGSMEGLYAAVLHEAPNRVVSVAELSTVVAGLSDGRSRLEAFLGLLVRGLTGPASSSWVLHVLAREITSPSPFLASLREKEILPKTRILRGIVGELMGLPDDHPAVARGCISVVSPCLTLLLMDRDTIRLAFPQFGLKPDDAPALVRHLVEFALAGLAAVAKEYHGGGARPTP